jgi:hypothetical protein
MKPFPFVCALAAVCALSAAAWAAAPATPSLDEARMRALFERLGDDDFEVRQAADRELRALGKAAHPRLLAERILTDSLEVFCRIDKMTASMSQPERLAAWARLLDHPDARCRDKADETLRHACPAALPALLKIKNTLDPRSRARLDKLIDDLAEAAY